MFGLDLVASDAADELEARELTTTGFETRTTFWALIAPRCGWVEATAGAHLADRNGFIRSAAVC